MMERTITRLVLLFVIVSEAMMDPVYGEKILCWKKVKEGDNKKLNEVEFDKYILPTFIDLNSCCNNGGVGTTVYKYPWDKFNAMSRDPNMCKDVERCSDEESCACKRNCNGKPVEKVCGSDGQTYQNKCEMFDAACKEERTIKISYNGECKAYCEKVKCPRGYSCIFDQNGISHCIERKCDCIPTGGKVCGLDDKTYETKCHLQRAECKSHRVIPVKYHEPCDKQKTCKNLKCREGQACVTTGNGQPKCINCCKHTNSSMKLKLCGSNGKLYENWCELTSDACSTGQMITIDFQPNKCKQNQKKVTAKPI